MSTLADIKDNMSDGDYFDKIIRIKDFWAESRFCKMVRTFHPVGHGAFYTEKFYDENNEQLFCAVYDCGCFEFAKKGVNAKFYQNRIDKCIKDFFKQGCQIDILFLSHLHNDHINGVKPLLEHCNVKQVVLPALEQNRVIEAILYNYIQESDFSSSSQTFIEQLLGGKIKAAQLTEIEVLGEERENKNIVSEEGIDSKLSSGSRIVVKNGIWLYIPINIDNTKNSTLIEELESATSPQIKIITQNGKVAFQKVKEVVEKIGLKECMNIYRKVFGSEHNSYSMPVFSLFPKCDTHCHPFCHTPYGCWENCLYMGDFEAKTKYKEFKKSYEAVGVDYKVVGVLQVPHHGSQNNLQHELYKRGKLCIISAGKDDKYKHPDLGVLSAIQLENSIPIIVTEDEKTKQQLQLVY